MGKEKKGKGEEDWVKQKGGGGDIKKCQRGKEVKSKRRKEHNGRVEGGNDEKGTGSKRVNGGWRNTKCGKMGIGKPQKGGKGKDQEVEIGGGLGNTIGG